MAITLNVKPEELVRAADGLSRQISNIERAFGALDSTINRSVSYWEGDASEMHRRKYKAISDDIQQTLKLVRNRPDDLLKMAGLYQKTEAENTDQASGLSDSIIS